MVKLVIFDLDGTLLDTERVIQRATKDFVERHDREYTEKVAIAGMGKRPFEATQALIDAADLPCEIQQVMEEVGNALSTKWNHAELLPGAERILRHLLKVDGLSLAVATSTPKKDFPAKVDPHSILREAFSVVVVGDDVQNSKPAPDIFLEAMHRAGVKDPSEVLVFEDSPSGIEAAVAAKMKTIAVPSVLDFGRIQKNEFKGTTEVLSCLYDFDPTKYGLPAFSDQIGEVIPIEPWRVKGPVVKGFGRGSKQLGIPTANLPPEAWDNITGGVPAMTSGIYSGWASVGDDPMVYPVALSVGWNPSFEQSETRTQSQNITGKTLEPWLLHTFQEDFYGEELRLVVCGYIRPEAPFTTMEALIDRIHLDGKVTMDAFQRPSFFKDLARDKFLLPGDYGFPGLQHWFQPGIWLAAILMCILLASVVSGSPDTPLPEPISSARWLGMKMFGGFVGLTWVCVAAWVTHFFEMLLALKHARRLKFAKEGTIAWCFLTLLAGYFALRYLVNRKAPQSTLEALGDGVHWTPARPESSPLHQRK